MSKDMLLEAVYPLLKEIDQPSDLIAGKDLTTSSLQSLALECALALRDRPDARLAFIFPTLFDMQRFSDALNDFTPETKPLLFPKDEIIRPSGSTSSSEMERERLRTLAALSVNEPGVVIMNSTAVLESLIPPDAFTLATISLKVGDTIDRDSLIQRLSLIGYSRADWVNNPFEFAARGFVIDIFSPAQPLPIRIEFDDDTIDSITTFTPGANLDGAPLQSTLILPCTERPLTLEATQAGISAIKKAVISMQSFGVNTTQFDNLKSHISLMVDEIQATKNIREGYERYFAYFKVKKASILDYLSEYSVFCVPKAEVISRGQDSVKEEKQYLEKLRENRGELPLATAFNATNLNKLSEVSNIDIDYFKANDHIGNIRATNRNISESAQLFNSLKEQGLKILACLSSEAITTLTEYLTRVGLTWRMYPQETDGIQIMNHPLGEGLIVDNQLAIVSSKEIYGTALKRSRFLTRYKEFQTVKKYSDLKEGDYVVHEDDGIGIYRGLQQIDGIDYLKLEYAKGTTLFVPVFQFSKIRKYAGSEAARPALDVIGGSTWARRKAKIRSRLTFLTDRLLNIYAERAALKGISFKPEPQLEDEFASRFQYPLTESQIKAWDSIAKDMESPHPMDRLIAGDVGFGKTELAFKACFRAIVNGYQAAILCPTTVLARQHFEVATERFKDFGVKIALLSRLQTGKEEAETLREIAAGKIDLIIGTHRLLSRDIKFKKLGFLAVDEEQRFGVAQKERIKEMTKNIDVISLSATPIPRTLQMSLMSIKPISILAEAPSNRLPVKTFVVQQDEGLIREVIARELSRKGQVYLLHNRIDTIYTRAGEIRKMFPSARVEVAHGRMEADQIADIMNDFYDGKIDVLVCTSIVESGLDVPNVNTVIVEDAQNFGLSALYQIKGRVGRSDRMAYAYLFYRNYSTLTDEGKSRLKAIREFTALGSGYRIAQQDLAIRGAGNILGTEQAGFVDSLGIDAYNQLLQEVMKQKIAQEKGLAIATKPKPKRLLSFTIEARIPDEYANESDRINLYREMADCTTLEELDAMAKRTRDSYGPLPQEIITLLCKRRIEIYLEDDSIFEGFEEMMETFKITLAPKYSDIPDIAKKMQTFIEPINDHIQNIRFSNRRFIITLKRTADYMSDLLYLVSQITASAKGEEISSDYLAVVDSLQAEIKDR